MALVPPTQMLIGSQGIIPGGPVALGSSVDASQADGVGLAGEAAQVHQTLVVITMPVGVCRAETGMSLRYFSHFE